MRTEMKMKMKMVNRRDDKRIKGSLLGRLTSRGMFAAVLYVVVCSLRGAAADSKQASKAEACSECVLEQPRTGGLRIEDED